MIFFFFSKLSHFGAIISFNFLFSNYITVIRGICSQITCNYLLAISKITHRRYFLNLEAFKTCPTYSIAQTCNNIYKKCAQTYIPTCCTIYTVNSQYIFPGKSVCVFCITGNFFMLLCFTVSIHLGCCLSCSSAPLLQCCRSYINPMSNILKSLRFPSSVLSSHIVTHRHPRSDLKGFDSLLFTCVKTH